MLQTDDASRNGTEEGSTSKEVDAGGKAKSKWDDNAGDAGEYKGMYVLGRFDEKTFQYADEKMAESVQKEKEKVAAAAAASEGAASDDDRPQPLTYVRI